MATHSHLTKPPPQLCPFIAKTVLKLLQSTKESASQIDLDQFKKLAQLAKDHKMLGTLMMDDVVSKTGNCLFLFNLDFYNFKWQNKIKMGCLK